MEKKIIELEVKTNTDDIKGKFASLKSEISKTTEEVEQLSNAYGENSDEVKQASQQLESLKTAYKDLNKVATDVGATFEEVYGDLQPLTARMGEAEDRLYELTSAGKTNSKEYKDLLGVVGQYKRTMMETDLVVDAASQTMASKLSGALNGAASAFAVTENAMALVGVESKDLQATMVRLQAAMALSEGLQGINEAKSSFIALGSTAKKVFTSIKVAIGATGIGLLLVALGALYTYWDDIKAAVSGVSEEQKKLNVSSQLNLDIQKEKLAAVDSQDNILKLQGKTEREILDIKIAQTNEVINATKQQLLNNEKTALAQIEASKRNKEILSGTLQFLSYPLSLLLKSIDQVGKLLGKDWDLDKKLFDGVAAFVFDPEETKKEIAAVKKETQKGLKELENSKAGYQLAIKGIDKTASDEAKTIRDQAKETNKQIEADRLKAAQDLLNLEAKNKQDRKDEALKEIEEQLTQASDARLSEKNKAIQDVNDKYFSLIAKAKEYNQSTIELEQAQKDEIAKINKTASDALSSAQKEIDDKAEAVKKEKDEKEVADAKTLQDRKVQMVRSSFDVLTGIADSLSKGNEADQRKAFKLNKAASLGQAIVNTGLAITGALTAGGNPLKLATGMQFVEAGLVGTIGALNIAKIAGSQFDSGGGGGGGGATATAPQIPRFDIIASNPQTQLAQLDKQPIQAYVVSGEVTTAQSLERNRVRNATF